MMKAYAQHLNRLFVITIMLATLSACSLATQITDTVSEPVRIAETDLQKVYAAYATYLALREGVVDIAQDPEVSDSFKLKLIAADESVRPVANALLDAAVEYLNAKKLFDGSEDATSRISAAIVLLNTRLDSLTEATSNLILAFKGES